MNAIEMIVRIDQIIDRTRSGRFEDVDYMNAINAAIINIVKDRVAPIRNPRRYSVQSAQRIRDELYTLVPAPATGTLSSDNAAYPTGYLYYLLLYVTIGGTQIYCRPTSFNEIGPLKDNPFMKPSATKTYFNENVSGLKVHYTGTVTAYELHYIKTPDTVSIGRPRVKIAAGTALTNGATYYVYEKTVYIGTTYEVGETFTTAATTAITSGTVILSSNITNCNLPANMHDEVCNKAAQLLLRTVEDYNKEASTANEIEKN